jgi:hypothetical protein
MKPGPVSSIKLMLELPMPAPAPAPVQQKKEPEYSVEDKVREALECIDSGHESGVEWSMINRLYSDLCKLKKPNDRAKNLKKMIEPVLAKFGYHKIAKEK